MQDVILIVCNFSTRCRRSVYNRQAAELHAPAEALGSVKLMIAVLALRLVARCCRL